MLMTEYHHLVEWAEPLPGRTLPRGWLPLSVVMLDTLREGVKDGHAAPHDPILHYKLPEIPEDTITLSDVRHAATQLREAIAREQERSGDAAAGLSANQIRIPARMAAIALDLASSKGKERAMTIVANPRAVPIADPETGELETITVTHGCVKSCLECWANIYDPKNIRLTGWDATSGRPRYFERELHGFASAIVAHEIRHLDGITSPDHALRQNSQSATPCHSDRLINGRPAVLKQQFRDSLAADPTGYSWPYKVPLSQWAAIKDGSFLRHYVDLDREGGIY